MIPIEVLFSYSFSDLTFLSQSPLEQENCVYLQKIADLNLLSSAKMPEITLYFLDFPGVWKEI